MRQLTLRIASLLAMACSSSAFAIDGSQLEFSLGTAELDFENSSNDEDAGRIAGSFFYPLPTDTTPLTIFAGATLSRSSFDINGIDAEYIDGSITFKLEYDTGKFSPFARFDYIIFSNGDYKGNGVDADLENEGYELNIGGKLALTPKVSASIETTLTANKSFELESGGQSAENDYDYGLFDAFVLAVQYQL